MSDLLFPLELEESKEHVENRTINKYILDTPRKIIGKGGQGWVELATNIEEYGNTKYIVKFSNNPVEGRHEYTIMEPLYHPTIIKVFGFYENKYRSHPNTS